MNDKKSPTNCAHTRHASVGHVCVGKGVVVCATAAVCAPHRNSSVMHLGSIVFPSAVVNLHHRDVYNGCCYSGTTMLRHTLRCRHLQQYGRMEKNTKNLNIVCSHQAHTA